VAIHGSSTLIASAVVGSTNINSATASGVIDRIPHISETGMNDIGWQKWFDSISKKLTRAGQIAWTQLSFYGSNLTDIVLRRHSDLQEIQGGAVGDQYHLLKVHSDLFTSGTSHQLLHGSPTVPTWGAVDLTTEVTGTLPATNGGTGIATYLTGDLLYSSATNTLTKLAGNITTTRQFLTQTGSGAVSAAPAWGTIVMSDLTGVIPTLSAGTRTAPAYTDNGDGTLTLGSGVYTFYSTAAGELPLTSFTIAGATYSFTDVSTNYIVANYNGGSPTITVTTSNSTFNFTTIYPLSLVYRNGTSLHLVPTNTEGLGLANKLWSRLDHLFGVQVEPGGFLLGEVAVRQVTVTSGTAWHGTEANALAAYSSAVSELALWSHVAGVWTRSVITAYDNANYDNGTNLVALSGGKYSVNWVYRTRCILHQSSYIVLGGGNYNLAQAQQSTAPLNLPPEVRDTGFLVGRIIVLQGAAVATQIDSAFTQNFASGGVSDHTQLSNLAWSSSGHTGTASNLAGFDGAGATSYYTVASANTASAVVQRDVSGNFTAGTITAALTGTASGNPAETATTIGALIGGAADAVPNDTDFVATSLTAAGVLKKITWTNVKVFLKTYFDTLYVSLSTTRREVLSAARTYYVRTDGNDSNTGLANTAGGAFLTIQKGIDVAAGLDSSIYDVTIQIADGTYTGVMVAKSMSGSGKIIIQGNAATPANVIISNAGNLFSNSQPHTVYTLKDLKFADGHTFGMYCEAGSNTKFSNLVFGSGVGHLYTIGYAFIEATGNYSITGGAVFHLGSNCGTIKISSVTATLTGTPAFSGAFATAGFLGYFQIVTTTFTGAATGSRYSVTTNAAVQVNGHAEPYLPGNAAGTTATGGVYS